MDKSDRPSSGRRSGSLRGREDPSPVPPQRAASVPVSAVVGSASFPVVPGGGTPSIYLRSALLGLDPPPRPQPMPLRSPPSSSPLCDSPRCVADDDDDAAAPVVVVVVAATVVVVVVVAAIAVSIAFAIPSTLLCTNLFDCCVADDDDADAVVVTAATLLSSSSLPLPLLSSSSSPPSPSPSLLLF